MFEKENTFYELCFFKWKSISYDIEVLNTFMRRYKLYKFLNTYTPFFKNKFTLFDSILEYYNKENILLLYNRDEKALKMALVEKWARKGALEVLINGKFSIQTYQTISNLPVLDFNLILKRTNELVNIGRGVVIQDYHYLTTSVQ